MKFVTIGVDNRFALLYNEHGEQFAHWSMPSTIEEIVMVSGATVYTQ